MILNIYIYINFLKKQEFQINGGNSYIYMNFFSIREIEKEMR